MATNITPISTLPEVTDLLTGDEDLAIVKDGVTSKIKAFRALSFTLPEWRSELVYNTDQIVSYDGQLWKSLQDVNQGHMPALDSSWWLLTAVTPSIDVQGDNANHQTGRFVRVLGLTYYQDWAETGHRLTIIDPNDFSIVSSTIYNTVLSGTSGLITALEAVDQDHIVTLASGTQVRIDQDLRDQLALMGGKSSGAPGSGAISHVFIGQHGLDPGQGYEAYDTNMALRKQSYASGAGLVINGAEGPAGPALMVEGSVDASDWHPGLQSGDIYMRTSEDGGVTWSDSVRVTGEDGESGKFTNFRFARNFSDSSPPSYTENADNPGANWYDSPQTLGVGEYQWMIKSDWRDTVRLTIWTAPVRLSGERGEDGADGTNGAQVILYKRSATVPAKPTTTATYTFATGVLTGHDNGWTQVIPATDGNPCWAIAAAASSNTATDTIPSTEWSNQEKVIEDGAPGLNSATVKLYKRSATTPAVPSTTATYTFATGVLTGHNNSWTQTEWGDDGNPEWVILAVAISSGATDTITMAEWSAPVEFVAPQGIVPPDDSMVFALTGEELSTRSLGTKVYGQTEWSTVDGWASADGGPALTVSGGSLIVGSSGSFGKFISIPKGGAYIKVRARTTNYSSIRVSWVSWIYGSSAESSSAIRIGPQFSESVAYVSALAGNSYLQMYANNLEIDFIEIYDAFPVFSSKIYDQDDWATVDGWSAADGGAPLTVSGGSLIVSNPGSFGKFISIPKDCTIAIRAKTRYGATREGGVVSWIYAVSGVSPTQSKFFIGPKFSTVVMHFNSALDGNNYLQIYHNDIEVDRITIGTMEKMVDSSKAEMDLYPVGVGYTNGKSGRALSFSTGSILRKSPINAGPSPKLSIALLGVVFGSSPSRYRGLIGNRSWSGSADLINWYLYRHATDGSLQLQGSSQYKSSYVPPLNTSLDIFAVVDGSNYSLWVNGALVQSRTDWTQGPDAGAFQLSGWSNYEDINDTEIGAAYVWSGYALNEPNRRWLSANVMMPGVTSRLATERTVVDVAAVAPRYLGKFLNTAPTATNPGDKYTRYSESAGTSNRGVFKWTGSTWVRTEDIADLGDALPDIQVITTYRSSVTGAATYGTAADYTGDSTVQASVALFQLALINWLQAGKIQSLNYSGFGAPGTKRSSYELDIAVDKKEWVDGSGNTYLVETSAANGFKITRNGVLVMQANPTNGKLVVGDKFEYDPATGVLTAEWRSPDGSIYTDTSTASNKLRLIGTASSDDAYTTAVYVEQTGYDTNAGRQRVVVNPSRLVLLEKLRKYGIGYEDSRYYQSPTVQHDWLRYWEATSVAVASGGSHFNLSGGTFPGGLPPITGGTGLPNYIGDGIATFDYGGNSYRVEGIIYDGGFNNVQGLPSAGATITNVVVYINTLSLRYASALQMYILNALCADTVNAREIHATEVSASAFRLPLYASISAAQADSALPVRSVYGVSGNNTAYVKT